jgi:hypothetical protein
MDLSFHIRKLLSHMSLARGMTFEELHDESQKRHAK